MARKTNTIELDMRTTARSNLSISKVVLPVSSLILGLKHVFMAIQHRNKRNEILAKRVEAMYYEAE